MSKTNRTYRVVCGACQGQVLVFYRVSDRLTVDVRQSALYLDVDGTTLLHRVTDGRIDVEHELADCVDSILDVECKCQSRTIGLRAHADRAAEALATPGKRVISEII